ncbi:glycosyltransferase family 2 protein [Neptuniibacter marinus]|uniref:glycosyltransferase family 2 protein n=1 Tax=Neptuniibacter marinus TaxID=1806670 RepID=UPI003B5BC543
MDSSQPKISIVITCYNYEKYIETSIESVLNQDYANKELIVVDDVSSDSSREIINEYKDCLSPIFHKENKGQGCAFNSGYAASTGELVIFLDADDYLLPGALDMAAANMSSDCSIYMYHMDLVDAEGRAYDVFPKYEAPFDTVFAKSKLLRSGWYQSTVTSGLVFSRFFLDQVMPMNGEAFREGSDGYLVTLAPLYGSVRGFDEKLSAYRQHGENHSGFNQRLLKRAEWCLEHDRQRYIALSIHAGRTGNSVSIEQLGNNDLLHLEQCMCKYIFSNEQTSKLEDRRFIADNAIKALKYSNLSVINIFFIKFWWLLLKILPNKYVKVVFAWRMLPSSRPLWLKKIAKFIRRV